MFTEAKKSSSVEVAHRLGATLVARCSDSDFIYEIENLRLTSIDASSIPARCTIDFVLVLRCAEEPNEFITFYSQIKDLHLISDFYNIESYEINMIDSNVSDYELKERMIKAFESYSSFNLEFSIES